MNRLLNSPHLPQWYKRYLRWRLTTKSGWAVTLAMLALELGFFSYIGFEVFF